MQGQVIAGGQKLGPEAGGLGLKIGDAGLDAREIGEGPGGRGGWSRMCHVLIMGAEK